MGRLSRILITLLSCGVMAALTSCGGGAETSKAQIAVRQAAAIADNKDDLYRFCAVAFSAAPGVTYMAQLLDAANAGMTIKEIVNIFTTKNQFTDTYPTWLSNQEFAEKLVANVVGASATEEARQQAIADIIAALQAPGWSRGDVIYAIFNNLANKSSTDPLWAGTSAKMKNQVVYARYYTEAMQGNTTDMGTLRTVIANVDENSSTTIDIQNAITSWLYPLKASIQTTWTGAGLEGQIEYCKNRSIRWISAISGFDVNRDGVNDFIIPISCYQGPDPQPGELHNRQIIAAWKMWCSRPDKSYYDCTQEKFGTISINATGTSSGGGNPYIHVMEQPFDINNDGYPDFWYALNRDDGRRGADYSNPEDLKTMEALCGPYNQNYMVWDCTRKSNQSVLLSRQDGTYRVVMLPWSPVNTNAMVMLPNLSGTYDAFAFNYGHWQAARLVGDKFVDVTDEYANYTNVDEVGLYEPYVRAFVSEGITYLAKAGVPNKYMDVDVLNKNGGSWGFALWKWSPGVGFELSDTYMPAAENIFTYNEKAGDASVKKYGAYIRDVPTFYPRWHFFKYATLDSAEGPILYVAQEAGTTAGKYYKTRVDPSAVYSVYANDSPDNQYKYTELSAVEGFYVRNGKIFPRMKSVVEGDVVWNAAAIVFQDINKDGYVDGVGISGHEQRTQIFLNNKAGVLQKINVKGSLPAMVDPNPAYGGNIGWTIGNFGDSNYLGLMYWGIGFAQLPSWAGTTYPIPGVRFIQNQIPINSLPVHTVTQQQNEIQTCLSSMLWISMCSYY